MAVRQSLLTQKTYLTWRHGPHLKVVRTSKDIREGCSQIPHIPLVKVLRLSVGHAGVQRSIDQGVDTLDLVVLGQNRDVVLEGVGHPETLVADIRDTLVGVPVGFIGESLVETVVKVLVVREDDMAADIVELEIVARLELTV